MKLKRIFLITLAIIGLGVGLFLFEIYHTPKTFDDMVLMYTLMNEVATDTEANFSSSILSEDYSRPMSLANISLEGESMNSAANNKTIVISGTAEFTNNSADDKDKARPHFHFGAYEKEKNGEFASYSFQYSGGQNRLGVHSFFDNLHLYAQVPNDAVQEYRRYLQQLSETLVNVKSNQSEFYSSYVNGRHSFALSYPKSWSMMERNLGERVRYKTVLCFKLRNSTNECDVRADIAKDIDKEERLERVRQRYEGYYLNSTTIQIAGQTGTNFEIGGYGHRNGVTRVVIFKKGDSLYEFTVMRGIEEFLSSVLNTIKFN